MNRRRQHIGEALRLLDKGLQHLDEVQMLLKDEPRARVRRLRSGAIINLDDVAAYSDLLWREFPDLVYFFANYKSGTPTPDKFAANVPVRLFSSLKESVKAALVVEVERPAYNGPNFNRPDVFVRWPWPEELASGDPERLIAGREFPDDVFDLALQYRDVGRWFSFHFRARGYSDPRASKGNPRLDLDSRSRMAPDSYPDFEVLDTVESEFFALYDLNDAETMAFAKRAHALWRRISTKNVALYDPVTRGIAELDPDDWTRSLPMEPGPLSRALGFKPRFTRDMPVPNPEKWTHRRSIGKQALAGALETPPRYAAFAFTPADGKSQGPALMIGPRPKARRGKSGSNTSLTNTTRIPAG